MENQDAYADVVPPANLSTAVAVEEVPSHCGFSPAELAAGWESLRAWVGGGMQPTAADIQGLCLNLEMDGVEGPCRYDPNFVVPDIDYRIRPRPTDSKFAPLRFMN